MSTPGWLLHALRKMRQRGITSDEVESVVRNPNNSYPGHDNRLCLDAHTARGHRLRVVLEHEDSDLVVVTTYYLS